MTLPVDEIHQVAICARIRPHTLNDVVQLRQRDSDHTGLSAELVTPDPLVLDNQGAIRPDRPIVRVERAAGSWSEAVPIERRASITLRTNRVDGRLRIDTDTGRHAGLATTLEIGPTVAITLVERPT